MTHFVQPLLKTQGAQTFIAGSYSPETIEKFKSYERDLFEFVPRTRDEYNPQCIISAFDKIVEFAADSQMITSKFDLTLETNCCRYDDWVKYENKYNKTQTIYMITHRDRRALMQNFIERDANMLLGYGEMKDPSYFRKAFFAEEILKDGGKYGFGNSLKGWMHLDSAKPSLYFIDKALFDKTRNYIAKQSNVPVTFLDLKVA